MAVRLLPVAGKRDLKRRSRRDVPVVYTVGTLNQFDALKLYARDVIGGVGITINGANGEASVISHLPAPSC